MKGVTAVSNTQTAAWKGCPFLGYIALTAVIPIIDFIHGGVTIAKGGKRKVQGVVLFLIANISVFLYEAAFTAIIAILSPWVYIF
jgi:hypothetical protein